MRLTQFLIILCALGFFGCNLPVKRGEVIAIKDGDSVIIKANGREIEVRLQGIDAPEFEQPYAKESRTFLKQRILNQVVELENYGTDRYDRTLAIIFLDGVNINLEMIQEGMAWHYAEFHQDREWARAQSKAEHLNLGLWAGQDLVNPADWREEKRESKWWF